MKISCLESFMHCIFVVVILVTNAYNFAPLTKYVRKDGDSIHGLNVIERSKAKKEQTTCLLFLCKETSCSTQCNILSSWRPKPLLVTRELPTFITNRLASLILFLVISFSNFYSTQTYHLH